MANMKRVFTMYFSYMVSYKLLVQVIGPAVKLGFVAHNAGTKLRPYYTPLRQG